MSTASSYSGYSGQFSLGGGSLSLSGASNYGGLFGQSSLSGYGNAMNSGSYYLGNTTLGLNGAMPFSGSSNSQTLAVSSGGISTSTTVLIFMGVAVLGALVAAGLER